jgi:hypothetical protein
MRTFPEFQDEVMKIDPRLTVERNPNRPQIANIKLDGMDICPIPSHEIRDEHDPRYTLELPNGSVAPHRSRKEALIAIQATLDKIKTPEGADMFFGRNGF